MRLEKTSDFAHGHNQRLKSCEDFWNRSSCLVEKEALLQIMSRKIEMSFETCFSELVSWLCSLKFSHQCFPKLAVGILAI